MLENNKKCLLQETFPIRIQGIHIVNEPWVFKMILSMIWPFLSTKMRSRLFFHGDCMATLHQQVNPAALPSDYNGWLESADEMVFTKTIPENECSNIFDCFNQLQKRLNLGVVFWDLSSPQIDGESPNVLKIQKLFSQNLIGQGVILL